MNLACKAKENLIMCPYLDEKALSQFCEKKFNNIIVFTRKE